MHSIQPRIRTDMHHWPSRFTAPTLVTHLRCRQSRCVEQLQPDPELERRQQRLGWEWTDMVNRK